MFFLHLLHVNMLLVFITIVLLFLTRFYCVLPKRNVSLQKKKRIKACKTCIVLGSGKQYQEHVDFLTKKYIRWTHSRNVTADKIFGSN